MTTIIDGKLCAKKILDDLKQKTTKLEKKPNLAVILANNDESSKVYVASKENETTVLSSIIKDGDLKAVLPAEMYESYGTVRFVNEFPLIIDALLNGGTLVMDEFDASIHPMALMNIINIFHNDDINIHHAQLIFNTHNPIFLNANLFRRDEIKFVERDDSTHASEHYSLSDFKTFGERGVRKGEDYMKNYFVNQYGAIKDVDFSSILESIVTGGDNNG